jgi:CheY-like chemotaxis protein
MKPKLSALSIIDDDEIFHLIMKRTMAKVYPVQFIFDFFDGHEAIEYFKEKKENLIDLPQLILLDIQMPYMDGWQFMDAFIKIKFSNLYHPPVYIVTSSINEKDIQKAASYERINGYKIKPVTMKDFKEIISAWFEMR